MQQTACVSIVVPIYNQEKYLDASIASMMEQTYDNLQMVLVNDGSTDASTEILRRYAAADSRITLVEQPNGGLVDATLAGIQAAQGEFICFLDPDDLIGTDYVQTFMEHMTPDCDFVAAGFYYENKGILLPNPLREDRRFTREELRQCRDDYLFQTGIAGISNRFFISRWNKLYRASVVKAVSERFRECKHISLGEDSLFTYLVLCYSEGGKTISKPNSYYYNIGNQSSMMKTGQIQTQLQKALSAYKALKTLTEEFGTSDTQAYALYGMLVDSLRQRLLKSNRKQFCQFARQLRQDALYQEANRVLAAVQRSGARKLYRKLIARDSEADLLLLPLQDAAKYGIRILRGVKRHIGFYLNKCKTKGPVRAARLLGFQTDREQAHTQMVRLLPELERRIYPLLQPYLNKSTCLEDCPVENNIFVFWWDGFDKAPAIVRRCLASVRYWHPNYTVIPVDKNNYQQYTDIDPVILNAFSEDKISVQTFSDILRFNLLKNNGGVWIDATIFFTSECDLLKDLQNKSFTTLEFSTTGDFLEYEGIRCSWSGFFIASRKNGLFVRAVDAVFQQYYLKYHTYSTYFFIDITLMLCKKYQLDDGVLSKSLMTQRSMFALLKLLNAPFNDHVLEFIHGVPQKLSWSASAGTDGTFYGWLLEQYND